MLFANNDYCILFILFYFVNKFKTSINTKQHPDMIGTITTIYDRVFDIYTLHILVYLSHIIYIICKYKI